MSDIAHRFGFVDLHDIGEDPRREPALGIYPIKPGRVPIFAIPLSSAYKYADPKYLMETSFKIAEMFGMHPDMFIINRIADLIMNWMPELVHHLPATDPRGIPCAEGSVRVDGEIIEQFEAYTNGDIAK